MVKRALDATEKLKKKDGIELGVVNVRFIKPVDRESIVEMIDPKKIVVTVEDGVWNGGFNSVVREIMISENLNEKKMLSLGVPEEIIEVASREELLEQFKLNADGIYKQVRNFLNKK